MQDLQRKCPHCFHLTNNTSIQSPLWKIVEKCPYCGKYFLYLQTGASIKASDYGIGLVLIVIAFILYTILVKKSL